MDAATLHAVEGSAMPGTLTCTVVDGQQLQVTPAEVSCCASVAVWQKEHTLCSAAGSRVLSLCCVLCAGRPPTCRSQSSLQ